MVWSTQLAAHREFDVMRILLATGGRSECYIKSRHEGLECETQMLNTIKVNKRMRVERILN